jgi:hypothetical protein
MKKSKIFFAYLFADYLTDSSGLMVKTEELLYICKLWAILKIDK